MRHHHAATRSSAWIYRTAAAAVRVGVGVEVMAAATFVITMLLRTEQRWFLLSEEKDLTDMKTQQTSRFGITTIG